MSLNPQQAEAVMQIHGPLLVFAGAGSGKTRVITHRIRNMIYKGIAPSSIVAVSFTSKSAKEMRERLIHMMGRKESRGIVVSTFHALGNRILQGDIRLLGYRDPFTILDGDDQLSIFRDLYRSLKMDPDDAKKEGAAFLVSLCKNSGMSPEEWALQRALPFNDQIFLELYTGYHRTLKSLNAVDFDDLILLPQKLFREHPEVLERYHRRFRYFLIDEFQDTNPSQYSLLLQLAGHTRNLCVVGDDDQSIYGWRGADVGIIRNFEKDFPEAKTIRLELNYRSTQQILMAANAVVKNNTKRVLKELKPTIAGGVPLRLMLAENEEMEAERVASVIKDKILRENRTPGDFAILYRTNFQSRAFEQELRKQNIPLHVVGGYRFFDRKEVKDTISYLRVLANPSDEVSLLRVINTPKRGIGEGTIKKIGEYIESQSAKEGHRIPFYEVLQRMEGGPGLIEGIPSKQAATLHEFKELIEHYRREFSRARKMAPVLAALIRDLKFEAEFLREGDNDAAAKARMLNLSEIVNMLSYFEDQWDESKPPGLFDFLARISLQASDQDDDNPRGRVQLLTLHLSKGLEYNVVFLSGMNEGIFPAGRSLSEAGDQDEALEEERRLCYVGITRARQELILTHSQVRRRFGEEEVLEPSRFLSEIPPELLEIDEGPSEEELASREKMFLDDLKAISAEAAEEAEIREAEKGREAENEANRREEERVRALLYGK
ncbi:ATP-dependent helicase [Leptonema illini]|uniref:DNA 3'-5' helicase n=1 Tax=Leptonema illini DSM 21528 TaxID=929563 RepID=H2CJJ0_9LEPT|nr:UvrD-helicase domain-containing protein [Leptonema illini]EHQ07147.1 UvrD/REP helicase [Leptonema illini DSM 21528]